MCSGKLATILVLAATIAAAQVAQYPSTQALSDPVGLLQKRIESGDLKLAHDPALGYLPAVLKELAIPVSSQVLVFSKTSLQTDLISPTTPRALYFNDDVYVGWVPDSPMLEIASTDPRYGTVFYTMSQARSDAPSFARLAQPCTSCHGPAREEVPAPLLLMMSAATDDAGDPVGDLYLTTDRSPMDERWGGWYVSGAPEDSPHMGRTPTFDAKRYVSPHSDIVALALLAHQADVHNRISETAHRVRAMSGGGSIDEAVEPLVRVLLFSNAAPFAAIKQGPSGFAAEFTARGPRDSRGRSLRDFDLDRRLFRYPLSYLIYSDAFRQLPEAAKQHVSRRLTQILTGQDETDDFRHLSSSDRTAILQILTETLPEFARRN